MKKRKISILLATSILLSNMYTIKPKADTSLDNIYAYTYKTVIAAMNSGDQLSINDARIAVRDLPSSLDWAKGEFSKQLDIVQQKILVNIVKSIELAQKYQTQVNVFNARKTIPYNLPDIWRASYSSALDIVQVNIVKNAIDLEKKAINEQSYEIKEKALKAYEDIMENSYSLDIYLIIEERYNNLKCMSFYNEDLPNNEEVINPIKNCRNISIPGNVEDKMQDEENTCYIEEIEQAIFKRVNEERIAAGVSELTYNTNIERYARIKSKDMGDNEYFSHEDLQGNLIVDIMEKDGVFCNSWAENIAYTQGMTGNEFLAKVFMDNWMNSTGHKKNILSSNFTSIDIGVYKIGDKYYATQEFYR